MKRFITTNIHGDILGISKPAEGLEPSTGLQDTGLYVFEVTSSLSNNDIITMHYWEHSTSALASKPTRPGPYYLWESGEWVFKLEFLQSDIRTERDALLATSDWTQLPDSPFTAEQKSAWATYRQALRDLTDNLTGSEETVEDAPWPSEPTA
jgi:hypothetical protein